MPITTKIHANTNIDYIHNNLSLTTTQNQHPSSHFGDYKNEIHYTTTDHHVRWCNYNGEHQCGHDNIHMTRALPFGSCSKDMFVHDRLAK